ncbi:MULTISPECIES: M20 aminoacylase family protein [unclassified Serratia (in: enterobacteria)]|uniref:M20 aminoacylase family protein n=1 Tax=unclassified Serratia (in: enterobacteria) TaxID=2647522 RepID=UPI00307626D7
MKTATGIIPEIRESFDEMQKIRHDIHQHPELGYQEHRTSELIAQYLTHWGYKVIRGIGGTGVVGILKAGNGTKSIGLRADMDALPIEETTGLPYASRISGAMHACGHDGHTTTLLAAAKYLAQKKNFSGTVNLIFQPAEEGNAGAKAMIDDGLFTIAPCDMIFAIHNYPAPSLKFGAMCINSGAIMASADSLVIKIIGKGGHAASPQFTCDPIVISASVIHALQSIVSRNVGPSDCAVVSITSIQAGNSFNIIPNELEMKLTVRTLNEEQRAFILAKINEIVQAQVKSFGATASITAHSIGYPVLVNANKPTQLAIEVATEYFGEENVITDSPPLLASDDFAFMSQQVPGCYINIGAGEGIGLHNPQYDFNDELIVVAGSLWAHLTESLLR